MRRPSQDRPDEIAYADVAMAVLGPIMVLMVVFAVQAGTQDAARGCTSVDRETRPDAFNALVVSVGDEIDQLKSRTQDLRDILERQNCASEVPPDPNGLSPAVAAAKFDALAEVCSDTRREVIAATDAVAWTAVPKLIAGKNQLEEQARLCLASKTETGCETLDDPARQAKGQALSDWAGTAENRIASVRETLSARSCDVGRRPDGWTAVPQDLVGICPDDAAASAQAAGTTLTALRDVAGELDWLRRELADCLPAESDDEPADQADQACRALDDEQLATVARNLGEWRETAPGRIESLRDKMAKLSCDRDTRAGEPTDLPQVLVGLCPDDAAAAAERIETDLSALGRMAGELAWLQRNAADCLGYSGDCTPIDDAEQASAGRRLERWFRDLEAEIQKPENRQFLDNCPGADPEGDSQLLFERVSELNPALDDLADLCPLDQHEVLAKADLNMEAFRTRTLAYARIVECRARTQEIVIRPQQGVKFVSCEATMDFDAMTKTDGTSLTKKKYFENVSDDVADVLETYKHINRIDIIGRTDLTWPEGTCAAKLTLPKLGDDGPPDVVPRVDISDEGPDRGQLAADTKNMLLSTYRAVVYRKHLFEALARAGLEDKLRDRGMRIYAIGAGIDEPAFAVVPEGDKNADLRRIDIRFVQEDRADDEAD